MDLFLRFVPGRGVVAPGKGAVEKSRQTSADIAAIKKAISEAKSLDEMKRLEMLLSKGQVPGREKKRGTVEEEEPEEMDTTTNGRAL